MRKKSIIIGIFLSVICAISVPVFAMDGDTGMNDKEHDTVIFDEMVNQDVVEDEANEGIQHDSESVEEVVENEDSVEMSNDFESTEENTVQVESNPDQAIVTIPDEQLRIRIKRQLNLTLDDEITVARMKELTQISTISYGMFQTWRDFSMQSISKVTLQYKERQLREAILPTLHRCHN